MQIITVCMRVFHYRCISSIHQDSLALDGEYIGMAEDACQRLFVIKHEKLSY